MTITLDTLTLPAEMIWQDEFSWAQVYSSEKRTLQGKLLVIESSVVSDNGRPITLTSSNAWIARADIITLYGWVNIVDKELSLTMHDGTAYTVRFKHNEGSPISVTPLTESAFPANDTLYNIELKFMVV